MYVCITFTIPTLFLAYTYQNIYLCILQYAAFYYVLYFSLTSIRDLSAKRFRPGSLSSVVIAGWWLKVHKATDKKRVQSRNNCTNQASLVFVFRSVPGHSMASTWTHWRAPWSTSWGPSRTPWKVNIFGFITAWADQAHPGTAVTLTPRGPLWANGNDVNDVLNIQTTTTLHLVWMSISEFFSGAFSFERH